jgi:hypothetical protein
MNLSNRLDRMEAPARALETLREIGMEEERIDEVLTPWGIKWDLLTDEELEAIAPDDADPDRVYAGGPRWEDLTDDQLRRIANGEDPRTVLTGAS